MGKPDSKFLSQQNTYVSVTFRGNCIDKYGNFVMKDDKTNTIYKVRPQDAIDPKTGKLTLGIKKAFEFNTDPSVEYPKQHPDVHIPWAEWVKKKNWFNPNNK
jgi:hypothetical protein